MLPQVTLEQKFSSFSELTHRKTFLDHHFMKQHGGLLLSLVRRAGSDGAENHGYNIF